MQDLNEYYRLAENLTKKTKELGDSLWHKKSRRWTKKIRRKNYGT